MDTRRSQASGRCSCFVVVDSLLGWGTMADPYRATRQFERFLFDGVPEHPEPVWQRDLNAHATERYTGRPQHAPARDHDFEHGFRLVAQVVYSFEDETTTVLPASEGTIAPTQNDAGEE